MSTDRTGSPVRAGDSWTADAAPMAALARSLGGRARAAQLVGAAAGAWVAVSPLVLGVGAPAPAVNDALSGAAALFASLWAWRRGRGWMAWIAGAIGCWLLLAPVLFRAPTPAAFASDTAAGLALVATGLLLPLGRSVGGSARPPGWSYNPSARRQRAPVIALAAIGCAATVYMALAQLG